VRLIIARLGPSDRTNRDVIFARNFNCGVPCEEATGVTSVKRPFEYDSRVEFRKVEKDEQRFLDNPRVGTLGYSFQVVSRSDFILTVVCFLRTVFKGIGMAIT
jgi:hypothetical protein